MSCAEERPTVAQAVAIGLLHGGAELLPVSSSAHTTLLPWLADTRYARLDGASRKSFELALHAGTTAALLVLAGSGLGSTAVPLGGRRGVALATVAAAPAALAGLTLRGRIERRLAGPRAAALGLLAGSAAMLAADIGRPATGRPLEEVGTADALALGVAQAAALAPGVSRSGATLAAARWRGFGRSESGTLSFAAGLPLLVGAGTYEALSLLRSRRLTVPLAAGALASFASTLACGRSLRTRLGRSLPLAPFAIYRTGLALVVLRRLRALSRSQ